MATNAKAGKPAKPKAAPSGRKPVEPATPHADAAGNGGASGGDAVIASATPIHDGERQTGEAGAVAPPPTSWEGRGEGTTLHPVIGQIAGEIGEGVQLGDSGLPPIATGKTHLRIAARHDGFRRCGRAWPSAGITVAKADFSDDDIERLRAESELVVVDVDAG